MIDPKLLDQVAETMADELVAALTERPMPHHVEHLCLTDPILDFGRIDGIMFSGGVGEYVYGRETRDFGDIGRRLGRAIRARVDAGKLPWPTLPAHRMHPRDRLGCVGILSPAVRQHQLYFQSGDFAAAAESPGGAAALRL